MVELIGKMIGRTIYIICVLLLLSAFVWIACWGLEIEWTLRLNVGVIATMFLIKFCLSWGENK